MKSNERAELQKVSMARVGKWTNTVTAQREQKEAGRIKKLEDEEVSTTFILTFKFL